MKFGSDIFTRALTQMFNSQFLQKSKLGYRESLNYQSIGKQSREPAVTPGSPAKYRLVPTFKKTYTNTSKIMTDASADTNAASACTECVCIYCRFEFTPKMTTAEMFVSENYTGLDYCPKCTSQGGVIRKRDVDLSKLAVMRIALIDIVETQNRKQKLYSAFSSVPINPIWNNIAEWNK